MAQKHRHSTSLLAGSGNGGGPRQHRKSFGVSIDGDFTRTPVPVFLDQRRDISRDHRASVKDGLNMYLSERRQDNVLDDTKWCGNGFPGHMQFVPFFGRTEIRPLKVEIDMQVATAPLENSRALNVTQMGRSKDMVHSSERLDPEAAASHEAALDSLRRLRGDAVLSERKDDPHVYHKTQLEHLKDKQAKLRDSQQAVHGLRVAGLASINPRLGTLCCALSPQACSAECHGERKGG